MQENNKKDTEQCTLHGVIMSFVGGVGIEQIDIVDLPTAKFIKEHGFDKPTHCYYVDGNTPYLKNGLKRVKMNQRRMNHNKYDDFIYSAPTKEECVRWVNSL